LLAAKAMSEASKPTASKLKASESTASESNPGFELELQIKASNRGSNALITIF